MANQTTRLVWPRGRNTVIAVCFVSSVTSFAQQQVPDPIPMPPRVGQVIEVELISVVDGDTYTFRPIADQFRVRLSNADTWESRRVQRTGSTGITDAEIVKGKAAKEAVEKLLKSSRIFIETEPDGKQSVRHDNFGRTLATVKVYAQETGTRDVGDWLKLNGHTRN